jgi:benzoate transport
MTIAPNLERGAMSRFQVAAILICTFINMMDGFDVLVIAFTAPAIATEWQLSGTVVGMLLSAGPMGMVIGSLALGPLADKHGRRNLILTCLVVITAGMLLSGFSQNANQLTAMRLLTGIGIGGILPGLNTIVAEYSSLRWRSFWVSLLQTGYPIGATAGGIMTVALIAQYGWRSAFFIGAFAAAAMIPLVWKALPESLDYLITRRPVGALEQINLLLGRLGRPGLETLPAAKPDAPRRKTGYADLFSDPVLRSNALWLSLAFFMMIVAFYFVVSWTPKILVDSGMSNAQGISGGILLNAGGVLGSMLLGYLSSRLPLPRLVTAYVLFTAVLMVVFAYGGSDIDMLVLLATCLGFFLFGSMVGLYALAPHLFPTQSRAAGVSIAIGVGRIGGVTSPLLAGVLFDHGWAQVDGYVIFAVPLVITAFAVALLGRAIRRSELAGNRA